MVLEKDYMYMYKYSSLLYYRNMEIYQESPSKDEILEILILPDWTAYRF